MKPTFTKTKVKITPKVKRTRKSSGLSKKEVSKMIDKKMSKTIETKVGVAEMNGVQFNSSISSTSELYDILPNITEGTGDDNRIGNSILPQYTNIRGYVYASPDQVLTQAAGPLDVQMFILRNKRQRNSLARSVASDLNIIKRGKFKFQYDGTYSSSISPINVEDFDIIMKKGFRLIPIPNVTGSAMTPNVANVYPSNPNSGSTVYKFKHTIDWKKLGVGKLLYDSGTSSYPQNENVFFCLGFAQYNDPNTALPTTITPVQVTWTAITYYKDA